MKTYKVVEEIEVEDVLVDTILVERHIKDLKKAKAIADEDCEDFNNNPYHSHERNDGLEEYHTWRVYDEATNEKKYSVS